LPAIPLADVQSLSYLDGHLPGDMGFDPLHLGSGVLSQDWLRYAEVVHGRWAMLGVVGCLTPEALAMRGTIPPERGVEDNQTLLIIEIAVFSFLESKRYEGYKKTGEGGFINSYPFDPVGLNSPKHAVNELQQNGRLAMLAFLGFASTAAVNGQGPIESLQTHIADPAHNNVFTSSVGKESCVFVAVLSILPMLIEANKALGK
uniref:Lhca5 n=1 Tax=Dunaliella salina TaxID=3046 RepID=UPI00158829FB|nr:Chain 5, Lhca5 [Dunaliella salina]